MRISTACLVLVSAALSLAQPDPGFVPVKGTPGESQQWGSGWVDLESTTSFKKGDVLKIQLGGTAEKVLVRLLAKGKTPDMPVGILGAFDVPESRTLEIPLKIAHGNIWQVSVHGGRSPWNYDLGDRNGNATILSLELKSPSNRRPDEAGSAASTSGEFSSISGAPGESRQWGSGWIDLETTTSFRKGSVLQIEVGGSATKVLVRLLSKGKTPDMPVGILGAFDVPESRILEIPLKADYGNIWQISVHGGRSPWNYKLGAGNGGATLLSVKYR